jgi:16S rRNA (guanine966-N2)-methyltransferase
MKILAGRFKGIHIKMSDKMPYRPTKSRVRKSIFDKLVPFHYSSVLDLFSGSGIMGLEASSRGASFITFVDKHGKSLSLMKENSLKFHGVEYSFFKMDVFSFLKQTRSFDLIFADPPYGRFDLTILVETVYECLNKNGKLILECEKSQIPFLDADASDYGNTRILTWTKL